MLARTIAIAKSEPMVDKATIPCFRPLSFMIANKPVTKAATNKGNHANSTRPYMISAAINPFGP